MCYNGKKKEKTNTTAKPTQQNCNITRRKIAKKVGKQK